MPLQPKPQVFRTKTLVQILGLSTAAINRVLCGTKTDKTRRITIISAIREEK
jgi:hypothetical protein